MMSTCISAAPPPHASFDPELARKVVWQVVKRHGVMFEAYADIDRDDLHNEALFAVAKAFAEGKYDPSKSRPSTFITTVAHRQLMDMRRRRSGDARRQDVVRAELLADPDAGSVHDDAVALEGEDLVDYAAGVYATAARQLRDAEVPRLGRPMRLDLPQRVTLLAVMVRTGSTSRGIVKLLRGQPALRRAIGLTRIPDHKFFARLKRSQRLLKKSGAKVGQGYQGGRMGSLGCAAATAASAGYSRSFGPQRGNLDTRRAVESVMVTATGVWRRMESGMGKDIGTAAMGIWSGEEINSKQMARLLGVSLGLLKKWRKANRYLDFKRYPGGGRVMYLKQQGVDLLNSSIVRARIKAA